VNVPDSGPANEAVSPHGRTAFGFIFITVALDLLAFGIKAPAAGFATVFGADDLGDPGLLVDRDVVCAGDAGVVGGP
jgi:hypothetical protein